MRVNAARRGFCLKTQQKTARQNHSYRAAYAIPNYKINFFSALTVRRRPIRPPRLFSLFCKKAFWILPFRLNFSYRKPNIRFFTQSLIFQKLPYVTIILWRRKKIKRFYNLCQIFINLIQIWHFNILIYCHSFSFEQIERSAALRFRFYKIFYRDTFICFGGQAKSNVKTIKSLGSYRGSSPKRGCAAVAFL